MNEPIKLDGKYKYRNGEPARVICVDASNDNQPVISLNKNGDIIWHTIDGFFHANKLEREHDLIPDVPLWEGEIWVRDNNRANTKPYNLTDDEFIQMGYRKIKVREVEQCHS